MSASLDPRITTPYPGLRPFQQHEHPIFFGRGEQTRAMLKPLAEHRFLAVVGASGSGKSSLVRAGLLPALEQGMLRGVGRHWSMIIMRPGNDPFGNLARELHAAVEDAGFTAITEATLRGASSGFLQCLDDLEVPTDANVLLLVDQFEEIIRYSRQSDEARGTATAFVDLMLTTARVSSTRRVHVVLTTRSDFLGDCNAFPGLPEAINDSQFLTPRLQRDEIRQAIVGPLRSFETTADEDLINRILNDVGSDPDQLPLMQHALLQTWVRARENPERKRPGIHMALAHYRDAGGVARALHQHAESAWRALGSGTEQAVRSSGEPNTPASNEGKSVRKDRAWEGEAPAEPQAEEDRLGRSLALPQPANPEASGQASSSQKPFWRRWVQAIRPGVEDNKPTESDQQRIAKVLFKCLSDRSQEARLTRQLITVQEVADIAGVEWEDVREVVAAFQDDHRNFLYSPDKTLTPESTLDISHESLLRQWSRANEWMAEEEESANFYRQLLDKARKWNRVPPEAASLRSPDLENALRWEQRQSPTAAWCQRVERALSNSDDTEPGYELHAQYLRASESDAHRNRILRWAAVGLLSVLTITAVLFGIAASRARNEANANANEAIDRQVTSYLAVRDARIEQGRNKNAIYWNWMAADSMRNGDPRADRILRRLVDWSFREPYAWEHQEPVNSAIFSPDGKTILTASDDKTARLWDVTNGRPLGKPMQHERAVRSAVFSADGKTVLTISGEAFEPGAVQLWNAIDGTPRGDPIRHEYSIQSAVFSPNEQTVLTVSDGIAQLWSVTDGDEHGDPMKHLNRKVISADFSPDGKTVLTRSDGHAVGLWDATGRGQGELNHKNGVNSAVFSSDGKTVLTASSDGTAQLWDVTTRRSRSEMKHGGVSLPIFQDTVNSAVFSPDGKTVLTGSNDDTARLWDAKDGSPRRIKWMEHGSDVSSAVFSADGKTVLTRSSDTATLWNTADGTQRGVMRHDGTVKSATFSPDDRTVLTFSGDTARLWDANDGTALGEVHHTSAVTSAEFSPDGSTVLTAGGGNIAKLSDATDGTLIGLNRGTRSYLSNLSIRRLHHGAVADLVLFSPDGKTVLTVVDDTARLWNTNDGTPRGMAMQHDRAPFGNPGHIKSAVFSPDGKTVLTASDDGTARLWNARDGALQGQMQHKHGVSSAAFSPDGKSILTSSDGPTISLWDASNGAVSTVPKHQWWSGESVILSADAKTVLTVFSGHSSIISILNATDGTRLGVPIGDPGRHDHVKLAVLSPDGKTVLTARDDTASLWDTTDGTRRAEMQHIGEIKSAVFSADGKSVLITDDDKTARLWDTNGTLRGEMRHSRDINSAVFSVDGKTVLTSSDDHTARLWHTSDGKPRGQTMQHKDEVNSAVFSEDGKTVLTASSDKTARQWDATDGTPRGEPMRHKGPVKSAVFSADGTTVLTTGFSKTSRLWNVPIYSAIDPRQSTQARDWLQLSVECRTGLTRDLDQPQGFRKLTHHELVERFGRVKNEYDGRLADGSAPIPDELLAHIQADDDEPDHGTHKLVFAVCVIVVLAIAIAVLSRRSRGATAA